MNEIKVGDKLYQMKYQWGKKTNGNYYIFEVYKINGEHQFGGRGLDCYGGLKGVSLFIPENTFSKVVDVRRKKLERILK